MFVEKEFQTTGDNRSKKEVKRGLGASMAWSPASFWTLPLGQIVRTGG